MGETRKSYVADKIYKIIMDAADKECP